MPSADLIPHELPKYADRETFLRVGRRFVETSKELGGLTSTSKVLDVGCGIGRFAVALTDVLDEGSYDGTDVASSSIRSCTASIGSRFTNFRFHLIEANNDHYAPEHSSSASEVPFDFDDETFDLVFSNSLYTHLLEAETTLRSCDATEAGRSAV